MEYLLISETEWKYEQFGRLAKFRKTSNDVKWNNYCQYIGFLAAAVQNIILYYFAISN